MINTIQRQNVIKSDMKKEMYSYWKAVITQNIRQEWIDKENIAEIKNALQLVLPYAAVKDWIIVIGKDLGYNLQAKKDHLLVLRFQTLAFFIYQPKYLDMGKPEVIEVFSKKLDTEKIAERKTRVTILKRQNLLTDGLDELIRDWLAKFMTAYEEKLNTSYVEWEKHMISKVKMELQLQGKQGFWHMYISGKLDVLTEDLADCVMIFELDFSNISKVKGKKKLLIFQKKGFSDSVFSNWRGKIGDFMGFLGMLLIFIAVSVCGVKGGQELNEKHKANLQENYSHLPSEFVQEEKYKGASMHDQFCRNHTLMLYGGAVLFFSYLGKKLVTRFQKRRTSIKAAKKAKTR